MTPDKSTGHSKNNKRAMALKTQKHEGGFTLIELLVVILIIGILAAIAIPMFLNQRKAAVDAQVQADVKNAATIIETWGVKQGSKIEYIPGGLIAKPGESVSMTSSADAAKPSNKILYDIKASNGTTLTFGGDSKRYVIQGTNKGGSSSNVEIEYVPDAKADITGIVYDSSSGGLKVK